MERGGPSLAEMSPRPMNRRRACGKPGFLSGASVRSESVKSDFCLLKKRWKASVKMHRAVERRFRNHFKPSFHRLFLGAIIPQTREKGKIFNRQKWSILYIEATSFFPAGSGRSVRPLPAGQKRPEPARRRREREGGGRLPPRGLLICRQPAKSKKMLTGQGEIGYTYILQGCALTGS